MAASKSLILKGISGFAGTCLAAAGGFEVGYKLKASGVLSSDSVYVGVEPGDYVERIDDLGIPDGCDTSCDLTAEQLRNLKFEQRSDSSVSYGGLSDGDTFELTIEDSGDSINYPGGRKYILRAKETTGTVTIGNLKGDDIVLGGEGVVIREISGGGKLEKAPEEVNGLGIPRRCDETCQLTKEQLLRLRFEAKSGSRIEVDGLDDGEVELKVETMDDPINYPKGKKYTLRSKGREQVTIKGIKDNDIVLGKEGVVIRETSGGGKLEHLLEEVNELGIPKRCNEGSSCELTKEQLERLRFEAKGNKAITVTGLGTNNTVTLNVETIDDSTNYPKGKKYTLKSKGGQITIWNVKEGDITTTQDVVIRETEEGGKLEKAPEEVDKLGIPNRCSRSCQLTKEQLQRLTFEPKNNSSIKIEGLEGGRTVTLNVENSSDSTNYPKGKKYTLTSTGGKVTIKGVKEGEIVLESNQVVVIRETEEGGKLEKVSEEVNNLGIPSVRCISRTSCELTKEQLEKLKFETEDDSPIRVTGLGNNDKVTLKVDGPNDTVNYPKGRRYTFKVEKEGVRINGTKDGEIILEKGKDLLVRETIEGGKLETVEDVLGIPRSCNANQARKNNPQTCQLTEEQLKNIKFKALGGKRADAKVTGLDATIELTISWTEDSRYPGNIKYSFDNEVGIGVDIKISRSGQKEKVTIAKQKESWFKNENGQLDLVESKQKSEIKTEEANGILGKLGLERLKLKSSSSSDFNSFYSKKHNRKETSFARGDELKKIKFKDLDGGAEEVDDLRGQKIKVFFEYDNDANKFPYNMKFTFENDNLSPSVELKKKGKSSVQIWKKDTISNPDNKKNVFKVVDDQLVNVPQDT